MTILKPNRRKLITGLVSLVAAPAIVRASSLMPVRAMQSVRRGRELLFGMTKGLTAARDRDVAASYSIDNAAFAPCQSPVTEVEPGIYTIALTADELRGNFTTLHFTAVDAEPTIMLIDHHSDGLSS
jgi:hypothetical protein